MTKQYNVNKYLSGVNGWGIEDGGQNYSATLAASTEKTLTVNGNGGLGAMSATTAQRYLAIFDYEAAANVWVALNATAAVPASSSIASTTSMLNPEALIVKQGDVIHVITAGTDIDIGIRLYSISQG